MGSRLTPPAAGAQTARGGLVRDMPGDTFQRLVPDCRVSVGGSPLRLEKGAALTRVTVDLDLDLFGQCVLQFNDPDLRLINGKARTSPPARP